MQLTPIYLACIYLLKEGWLIDDHNSSTSNGGTCCCCNLDKRSSGNRCSINTHTPRLLAHNVSQMVQLPNLRHQEIYPNLRSCGNNIVE